MRDYIHSRTKAALIPPPLSCSVLPHLVIIVPLGAEGSLNELISRASFYSLGGKGKQEQHDQPPHAEREIPSVIRRCWMPCVHFKRDVPLSRELDIFQPLNQSCFVSWKTLLVALEWLLANRSPAPLRGRGQWKRHISDTLEEGREDGIKFYLSDTTLLQLNSISGKGR